MTPDDQKECERLAEEFALKYPDDSNIMSFVDGYTAAAGKFKPFYELWQNHELTVFRQGQRIKELEAERDELRVTAARLFSDAGRLTEERDELRLEVERLTAAAAKGESKSE